MSEELKPCPFCGVQPTLFENGKLACCESITCSGNQFPMLIWQWQSRPIEDELRSGRIILHEERARIEKLKVGKSALRNERNFLRRKHLEALAENSILKSENEKLKQDVAHYSEETEYLKNENDRLTAEVARLKAALEKLSVKENYYIINDHGMVYIGGDYKIYYTETAGQDDYHHPADIARAALAESEPK